MMRAMHVDNRRTVGIRARIRRCGSGTSERGGPRPAGTLPTATTISERYSSDTCAPAVRRRRFEASTRGFGDCAKDPSLARLRGSFLHERATDDEAGSGPQSSADTQRRQINTERGRQQASIRSSMTCRQWRERRHDRRATAAAALHSRARGNTVVLGRHGRNRTGRARLQCIRAVQAPTTACVRLCQARNAIDEPATVKPVAFVNSCAVTSAAAPLPGDRHRPRTTARRRASIVPAVVSRPTGAEKPDPAQSERRTDRGARHLDGVRSLSSTPLTTRAERKNRAGASIGILQTGTLPFKHRTACPWALAQERRVGHRGIVRTRTGTIPHAEATMDSATIERS